MRKRRPSGQRKGICSKCYKPVEDSRNGQRYCKSCHAANMRKTRPKHSELTPEARKKANARSYAKVYLQRGLLTKKPCEVCGDETSEMHPDDYDKSLGVRWLCRKHHLELHSKGNLMQQ